MKRYLMPFAQACSHKPEHPERTAKKSIGFDVVYQVWTNRAAMAKSIRMQQKRASKSSDWNAIIPLEPTEGY